LKEGVLWQRRLRKRGIFQIVDNVQNVADFGTRVLLEGEECVVVRKWVSVIEKGVFHLVFNNIKVINNRRH